MSTLYIRTFAFRDHLSDQTALQELSFFINDVLPEIRKSDGVRSATVYSGAGALRSQLRLMVEMDDSAGYERMLLNPSIRELLGRLYESWDLGGSTQTFLREVDSDLIAALSSTD